MSRNPALGSLLLDPRVTRKKIDMLHAFGWFAQYFLGTHVQENQKVGLAAPSFCKNKEKKTSRGNELALLRQFGRNCAETRS
ncbi:uncharacterized protein G2W53_035337 [Senna tora]|uniref:Uncharacterized protein n=1 Tax=Senna tora TaxID=362788 RepID=A0A834W962_9FABA|nr:uncharacterized protein G2W53_035337 [Senna tora]